MSLFNDSGCPGVILDRRGMHKYPWDLIFRFKLNVYLKSRYFKIILTKLHQNSSAITYPEGCYMIFSSVIDGVCWTLGNVAAGGRITSNYDVQLNGETARRNEVYLPGVVGLPAEGCREGCLHCKGLQVLSSYSCPSWILIIIL